MFADREPLVTLTFFDPSGMAYSTRVRRPTEEEYQQITEMTETASRDAHYACRLDIPFLSDGPTVVTVAHGLEHVILARQVAIGQKIREAITYSLPPSPLSQYDAPVASFQTLNFDISGGIFIKSIVRAVVEEFNQIEEQLTNSPI